MICPGFSIFLWTSWRKSFIRRSEAINGRTKNQGNVRKDEIPNSETKHNILYFKAADSFRQESAIFHFCRNFRLDFFTPSRRCGMIQNNSLGQKTQSSGANAPVMRPGREAGRLQARIDEERNTKKECQKNE